MGKGIPLGRSGLGKVVFTVGAVALAAESLAIARGSLDAIDRSNDLGQALTFLVSSTTTSGPSMGLDGSFAVPNTIEDDEFRTVAPEDYRLADSSTGVSAVSVFTIRPRW